jgi:hypothetical protein
MERLWADLATADPARAQQAVDGLVARSGDAVAWLKHHLQPVRRPDARQLAHLVADLDSERFAVRRKAARALDAVAEPAEPHLRQMLKESKSLEVRKTLERTLERLRNDRLHPPPERLRAARAVEVLERIGNEDARRLLTRLAAGAPPTMLTLDAQGALQRLAEAAGR